MSTDFNAMAENLGNKVFAIETNLSVMIGHADNMAKAAAQGIQESLEELKALKGELLKADAAMRLEKARYAIDAMHDSKVAEEAAEIVTAETTKDSTPWTPEQVDSMNRFQTSGAWHPFTCQCGALLVATDSGWKCPEKCGYEQKWAHSWMMDRSWEKMGVVRWPEPITPTEA